MWLCFSCFYIVVAQTSCISSYMCTFNSNFLSLFPLYTCIQHNNAVHAIMQAVRENWERKQHTKPTSFPKNIVCATLLVCIYFIQSKKEQNWYFHQEWDYKISICQKLTSDAPFYLSFTHSSHRLTSHSEF